MARYYGEIQGSRGEASRMGTASSGFQAHIRGWHIGASVDMYPEGDADRAVVYASTGSSGSARAESIGSLRNVEGVPVLTPSAWTIAQVERHLLAQRAEARRKARELAKLKTSATESATARRHTLTRWIDSDNGERSHSDCERCARVVAVDINPPANGIDIDGAAVAENCTRTVVTDYGTVVIHPESVAVSAEEGQLYAWSHRPGAAWPCSTLQAFQTLCAWFDSNGLCELQGYDESAEDTYSTEGIDGSELNAWSSDVLQAANLPTDHPSYVVAVGQFQNPKGA